MPDGELRNTRDSIPLSRCMRWHGLSVRVCDCMDTGQECPPEARRSLPKLTDAQIAQALAKGAEPAGLHYGKVIPMPIRQAASDPVPAKLPTQRELARMQGF